MSNDVKKTGDISKDTDVRRQSTDYNGAERMSAVEASSELGLG